LGPGLKKSITQAPSKKAGKKSGATAALPVGIGASGQAAGGKSGKTFARVSGIHLIPEESEG
jgi:hypothetical protein